MSYSYKDNKIVEVIQTMDNTGDTYNINGIDIGSAIFFYRANYETFTVMLESDYNITDIDDDTFLVVTNSGIVAMAEEFQIAEERSATASNYVPVGNPDLATLVDLYNDAIEEVQSLWGYVRDYCMLTDHQYMSGVIPRLNDTEVPYWDADSLTWKGYAVLGLSKDEFDDYVLNTLKPSLLAYTEQLLADLLGDYNTYSSNLESEMSTLLSDAETYLYNLINTELANYLANTILPSVVTQVEDVLSTLTAADIPIVDSGEYFTGTEVEAALQEVGAVTTNIILNGSTLEVELV